MASAEGPDPSILSSKRVVYVGGLADHANQQTVRAAFIPFGSVQSVDMVGYRVEEYCCNENYT